MRTASLNAKQLGQQSVTKGKSETLYMGKSRKAILNKSWCKEVIKIEVRIYLALKGNKKHCI